MCGASVCYVPVNCCGGLVAGVIGHPDVTLVELNSDRLIVVVVEQNTIVLGSRHLLNADAECVCVSAYLSEVVCLSSCEWVCMCFFLCVCLSVQCVLCVCTCPSPAV